MSFRVEEDEKGARLDSYIAKQEGIVSRAFASKLIESGEVKVNAKVEVKTSFKVREDDIVEVCVPDLKPYELKPEDMDVDVLYEDSELLVVNKSRGMVVHPAPGSESGTLVNALLARCNDLSGIGGVQRPGIVHRLDKDTTGVMLVAKNDEAHQKLSKDIARRDVVREYLAIVRGNVAEDDAVIDMPIGRSTSDRKKQAVNVNGRSALTRLHVLERFGDYTLVKLRLQTGRTHQIRVHMSYIGRPVAGDPTYGGKPGELGLEAQALHSWRIEFTHPKTLERMSFEAGPPEDFKRALELLRSRQKR